MNTSMPSASPDLATLISGGAQSKSDSLCQGTLLGQPNARSAQAETGDADVSDFAALLDAPANTANNASVTVAPNLGEGKQPVIDAGHSVLTAELSGVTATTSQIRNFIGGSNQAGTVRTGVTSSANRDIAPGTTLPRAAAVDSSANTRSNPTGLVTESIGTEATDVMADASGNPVLNVLSGRHGRRHGQSFSSEGRSVRSNRGEAPVAADTGVTQSGSVGVAPVIPVVIQVATILSGTESGHENFSAKNQANGVIAPVRNTDQAVSEEAVLPANSVQDPTTNYAPPARGWRTQIIFDRVTGGLSALEDGIVPVTENATTTALVDKAATEPTASAPLAPELRREVVETVAALLAPFWMSLQQVLPDLVAGRAGPQDGSTVATEEGNEALNAAITVKIGSLPPMKLELSLGDAVWPEANPTNFQSAAGQVAVDAKAAAVPVTPRALPQTANAGAGLGNSGVSGKIVLPAGDFSVVDTRLTATLPEDFRFQLKVKIQAAFDQVAPMKVAPPTEQIPAAANEAAARAAANLATGAGRPAAGEPRQSSAAAAQNGQTYNFNLSAAKQPELAPRVETSATPVEVMIKLPGIGSLSAQIVASQPATTPSEKNVGGRWVRAEKSAGAFKSVGIVGTDGKILSEKTFLNSGVQSLKAKTGDAGTAVADSSDNMPAVFTSRRVAVDQLELPPRITGREILPTLTEALNFSPSSDAMKEATPAPVLAHRAVETILNVVDAQRQSSANASSVNLHFKFGGDDLAVRVQLRGGEVTAQFLTDSAELRSALSTEWQNLAGQGGAAGLRLLEPTILPASAGASTGFGSASQGQNQAQHQAQHQQAQAAAAQSELRAMRGGNPVVAPAAESAPAPRISITSPTSQHLTALA